MSSKQAQSQASIRARTRDLAVAGFAAVESLPIDVVRKVVAAVEDGRLPCRPGWRRKEPDRNETA